MSKKPVKLGLLRSGTQRESYVTVHTFEKPNPHQPRPRDPTSSLGRYQMNSKPLGNFISQRYDKMEKMKENFKKSIMLGKKLMDDIQVLREENKILTKSVENFHIDNSILTKENKEKDEEIKKLNEELEKLRLELAIKIGMGKTE